MESLTLKISDPASYYLINLGGILERIFMNWSDLLADVAPMTGSSNSSNLTQECAAEDFDVKKELLGEDTSDLGFLIRTT